MRGFWGSSYASSLNRGWGTAGKENVHLYWFQRKQSHSISCVLPACCQLVFGYHSQTYYHIQNNANSKKNREKKKCIQNVYMAIMTQLISSPWPPTQHTVPIFYGWIGHGRGFLCRGPRGGRLVSPDPVVRGCMAWTGINIQYLCQRYIQSADQWDFELDAFMVQANKSPLLLYRLYSGQFGPEKQCCIFNPLNTLTRPITTKN